MQGSIVLGTRRSTRPHAPKLFDPVRNGGRALVLPRPDNEPAVPLESHAVANIPIPVSIELVFPPQRIRFGRHSVLRTAMPETSINEDSHPGSGEYDVWPPRKAANVHPVPQPTAMQFAT